MNQTFFHSNLAETLGNSNKLYYFCRALDQAGSGYADIDIYTTQQILNISHTTFYRYLKDTHIINNVVKIGKGKLRVFYKSLIKTALSLKIRSLGAIAWIQVSDLVNWRQTSGLLEALKLQNQSLHVAKLAERQNKAKPDRRKYISIDNIFESLIVNNIHEKELNISSKIPCKISPWAMLLNDRLYIDADQGLPYGGSQATVANAINKSTRTIRRRLQNTIKIQQALGKKEYESLAPELKFIDSEEGTNLADSFFIFNFPSFTVNTFKHYCNLYYESFTLTSCKFTRSKLNKVYDNTFT